MADGDGNTWGYDEAGVRVMLDWICPPWLMFMEIGWGAADDGRMAHVHGAPTGDDYTDRHGEADCEVEKDGCGDAHETGNYEIMGPSGQVGTALVMLLGTTLWPCTCAQDRHCIVLGTGNSTCAWARRDRTLELLELAPDSGG